MIWCFLLCRRFYRQGYTMLSSASLMIHNKHDFNLRWHEPKYHRKTFGHVTPDLVLSIFFWQCLYWHEDFFHILATTRACYFFLLQAKLCSSSLPCTTTGTVCSCRTFGVFMFYSSTMYNCWSCKFAQSWTRAELIGFGKGIGLFGFTIYLGWTS